MGNLCSIFHSKHTQVKLIAGSPGKADFLSLCLFMWQTSTYKIKDSDKIWFTRTLEDMAKESGCSESTIWRYLKSFEEKNLIEKVVKKRYFKKHKQSLPCLHIRITDKLLALLKVKTPENQVDESNNSKNFTQNDDSSLVNLTTPFNKENSININNNTVQKHPVSFVKKQQSYTKLEYQVEKEIGERITEELKDRVKGMLYNVCKKTGENPKYQERLFTEVIFSLTQPGQYKGITCVTHKINIISSLIRAKKWSTPKGFFKFWDVGEELKAREQLREQQYREQKIAEAIANAATKAEENEIRERIKASFTEDDRYRHDLKNKPVQKHKQNQETNSKKQLTQEYKALSNEIYSQERYLMEQENLMQQGKSFVTQRTIDSIAIEIAKLYEQQEKISAKLNIHELELCA